MSAGDSYMDKINRDVALEWAERQLGGVLDCVARGYLKQDAEAEALRMRLEQSERERKELRAALLVCVDKMTAHSYPSEEDFDGFRMLLERARGEP